MPGRDGVAVDAEDATERRVHDHRFPGVDIALTEFPQREDQREQVQAFLDDSLLATLCVEPTEGSTVPILVSLDNVGAGHSFPSGATSDRRVWVEVEAFRGDERVWSSGAVEPGEPLKDHLASDPGVWSLFTEMQTEEGEMTHRFWEAASLEGTSKLLQAHTTLDPRDPAYVQTVQFESYLARGEGIDRVRMAVHIRPLPLDLVDELIADGWLSAAIREEVPTFTLAPTVLEWTPDVPVNSGNLACVPRVPPQR